MALFEGPGDFRAADGAVPGVEAGPKGQGSMKGSWKSRAIRRNEAETEAHIRNLATPVRVASAVPTAAPLAPPQTGQAILPPATAETTNTANQ